MLASLSQFVRDAGSSITKPVNLFTDSSTSEEQSHHGHERDKASSPDTDIASATTSTQDHDEPAKLSVEAKAAERRRRKGNMIYETFIVVRPPPAVSNHPLNLQLQLVPPSNKEQARQVSSSTTASSIRPSPSTETLDKTANDTTATPNAPISERSPSLRSNRSATSLYSASVNSTTFSLTSSASISSTATTSSTRRIIPLYNLSAHNVLTNTVTDAGTDAKVAKFGKRGIEVIGLGILECFEVYGVTLNDPGLFMGTDPTRLAPTTSRTGAIEREASIQDHVSVSERSSVHEPVHTPSSSTSNLPGDKGDEMSTPTAQHVTGGSTSNQPAPSTPTPSSAKKIFGKMFKRTSTPNTTPKNATPVATLPSTPTQSTPMLAPSISLISPSASASGIFSRKQREKSVTQLEPTIPEDPLDAMTVVGFLQQPCLGTQATLLHRSNLGGRIIPHSAMTNLNAKPGKGGDRSSVQLNRPASKTSLKSNDRASMDQSIPPAIASPTFSALPFAPAYRKTAHSYEWVIRKWIKGSDSGLFNIKEGLLSAKSAVFSTTGMSPSPDSWSAQEVEVRFEWVKGRGSAARARDKIAKLRLTKGDDDIAEESGATEPSDRAKLGRGRPKSTLQSPSDLDPFLVAPPLGKKGSSRPTSMYNTSSTSLQVDEATSLGPSKTSKRQSMRSNPGPTTSPRSPTNDAVNRSPSPVRPSMDSTSRRSSDESENVTGAPTSTVYKGKTRRRRESTVVREVDDDEDLDNPDSDPEDSETPWICTLYVGPPATRDVLPDPFAAATTGSEDKKQGHKRTGSITSSKSAFALASVPSGHLRMSTSVSAHQLASAASASSHRKAATATGSTGPYEEKKGVKIKLGTMTPAPYHPKVVCQLRMPFPIPDVNVRRMEIIQPGESVGKPGDLILTMEEIKDVVCVTGLWLVVREGFGGLERRRKGDGWKIRG